MKCSRFTALIVVLSLMFSIPAESRYVFSEIRKDTPQDFNEFLNGCSSEELQLMRQALKDDGDNTPSAVRKALVWRAYNKTTYMFRSDDVVDYHEIAKWAAKKLGVESRAADNLPTYELEKEIVTKFFAKLWENLPPEKKQELVDEMVKEGYLKSQGSNVNWSNINYAEIAGQLWFFYQTNPELALALLAGAGTALYIAGSFLAALGPVGWAAIAAGGVWMAGADVDTVSSFIVAVNMIKTRKYMK